MHDQSRLAYLEPLFDRQKQPPWIATLNYDDSLEQAAESLGWHVDIGGMSLTDSPSGESSVIVRKLHGSIGRVMGFNGSIGLGCNQDEEPGILLGAGNKLQAVGPYLDLLFIFRDRLSQTSILHVSGYSFRDTHINHLLLNWYFDSANKCVVIHDPSARALPWRKALRRRPRNRSNRILLDAVTTSKWLARSEPFAVEGKHLEEVESVGQPQ